MDEQEELQDQMARLHSLMTADPNKLLWEFTPLQREAIVTALEIAGEL